MTSNLWGIDVVTDNYFQVRTPKSNEHSAFAARNALVHPLLFASSQDRDDARADALHPIDASLGTIEGGETVKAVNQPLNKTLRASER
jgi:hypothetical protein